MAYASKSPWVIHYDASSCNGCDIEVLAALCPGFDAERFGVINTGNPKHADIFLVTGSVNEQNINVIREIYNQMVEPKVVVACGVCACSGGVFHDCYNVLGGVDKAIPVDVYASGCAIRPEAIIDAVVIACGILDEKSKQLKEDRKAAKAAAKHEEELRKQEIEAFKENRNVQKVSIRRTPEEEIVDVDTEATTEEMSAIVTDALREQSPDNVEIKEG